MKYWWVNHKQTSKHEIAGGFLWSPMRKKNGFRNQFYENMKEAYPGDKIISYSHGFISHFGVVTDFATASPIPPSFGKTGQNWDQEKGWMLPVNWQSLSEPIRPKLRINEFGAMLPARYSPIDPKSGNGRENAYLAAIDKNIFDLLVGSSGSDIDATPWLHVSPNVLGDIDDALERSILDDDSIDSTTKKLLVASRRGQGIFKQRIYQFEMCCRLTGVENPGLLIASHIKPWRLCLSAFERLDGANGLLLTPHVDRLFDRGFISFSDVGTVLISPKMKAIDLERLGLKGVDQQEGRLFHARQLNYLEYHRKNIFIN